MNSILTYTGKVFDFDALDSNEYDINDIVHSLGLQNRFLGHTRQPWSVLKHSLLVEALCFYFNYGPATQLAALLHDASEAYIGDVPTPLKHSYTNFKEKEEQILRSIYKALCPQICDEYGILHGEIWEKVKHADSIALALEIKHLMARPPEHFKWVGVKYPDAKDYIAGTATPEWVGVWRVANMSFYQDREQFFINKYKRFCATIF